MRAPAPGRLRFLLPAILVIFFINLQKDLSGQIPSGYYASATGLSGESLKTALYNIIKGHHALSYDSVTIALRVTDQDPGNPNNVICLYSGFSYAKNAFGNGSEEWNREHVWSQSHGSFGYVPNPGTDLHHLCPEDASVNSAKSNRDFDECSTPYTDPSGATGCFTGTDRWEPRPAVKGDVARMMFYMDTRYEGENGEPDLLLVTNIFSSPNYEPYYANVDTLYKWHLGDPVDLWEQRRNDTIYYKYQHNRNPFIDHPEYVSLIWGGAPAEPSSYPDDFSANNLVVTWEDATGAVLPDGYLVRISPVGFEDIAAPVDGIPVANNASSKNVVYGIGRCVFHSLVPGITYYVKIFPFRGAGESINYKTDGTIQQLTIQLN
jgi:endonuclease I